MTSATSPLPGVGAVVVSHRTPSDAARCAEGLGRAGVGHVVVVDAGSGDDTATVVATAAPAARVLTLPNLGFGRSVNAGVAALPATVDVVLVANADTRWAAPAPRLLAAALRGGRDVAAAGPTVRYPDGRRQASARTLPSLGTAVGHAVLGRWWAGNPWTARYHDGAAAVDGPGWLSGCALALDRAAFDRVGGFDGRYFLYMEDVDLCVRLRAAGRRLVVVDDAVVVHEVGASTAQRPVRAVVEHARSIDRFVVDHVLHGPWRAARPLLWVGLVGWVASRLVWQRAVAPRVGRSTTGE